MPVARLDLAPASIVRADIVDVPPEARSTDGLGVSPWETPFLGVVRVSEAAEDLGQTAEAGMAAVERFRRLVTTLRLFKAGGVGLGPHAWTRIGGDRWRRIATGSGRQRPGGYRLTEDELGELAAFSRALSAQGTPFTRLADDRPGFAVTLGRALNRFEAGLERNVVIEALNDYLLALRFVLEGAGPADLGLSMRVAALCAEPERRGEVKAVVDRAVGLERELWSGEPAPGGGSATPAETAVALEDLARAILKDAGAGHLGSDLRTTADEILLADGFAVGDGAGEQRGGTTEWDLEPVAEEAADDQADRPRSPSTRGAVRGRAARAELEFEDEPLEQELELEAELDRLLPDPALEEVSELDERISPEDGSEPEEEMMFERAREIFGSRIDPEGEAGTGSLELHPVARRAAAGPADAGGGREPPPGRRRGSPAPGEPGAALDRADAGRARGARRPRCRALPPARDDRVERARDRLRPRPARPRPQLRLPPTTPRKSRSSHRAQRAVASAFPRRPDSRPRRRWPPAPRARGRRGSG